MRIFISHGTDKDKPEELDFLDTLQARLAAAPPGGGPGHQVLLDRKRIDAGDLWQEILHDMLAECQVALLLLGRRALDRPWVLKEATILSYRKSREPGFPFFCVLLPDLTLADIASRPAFAALGLDAVQAFAPGTNAEAVADWVLQHAATLQPPETTPLDRLERALESRLVQVDADALEALCEKMLGEPVQWMASAGRARQRARCLARAIVRGRLAGLGEAAGITAMIKALKQAALPAEHRTELLKLAAPMWVDAEIAGRFAALIVQGGQAAQAQACTAALNASRIRYSARMVAWRALLPDTADYIYWIAGGSSDGREQELVAGIRKAYFKDHDDYIDAPEEVDELLQARTAPIVFVLPPPVPDAALLQALHQRFPRVSFIAHTGVELPAPSALPDSVVPLAPGLAAEVETRHQADYLSALEALR